MSHKLLLIAVIGFVLAVCLGVVRRPSTDMTLSEVRLRAHLAAPPLGPQGVGHLQPVW